MSIGNAWEQFKKVNDARLHEIERKGSADPLYSEQLDKINKVLDQYSVSDANLSRYLREGSPRIPSGEYLLTDATSQCIMEKIYQSSPIRQLATVEKITYPALGFDRYVKKSATQYGKLNILVHEMYAQPIATQKLLDDASINIEQWFADKVAEEFSRVEAKSFIWGSGEGQPQGILRYNRGQIERINSGICGSVTVDGLVRAFSALKEKYTRNATFLMNSAVVHSVRRFKDATTNQYLWQPGLAAGAPDTLLGVPVAQASDMPLESTNELVVAVGDFRRAYLIVDRVGMRVLRDPFTEKPFIKFYTTRRVGGGVVDFEAIKLLKLAA